MPGLMERLTYLLGICVAVIGWAVAQIDTTLSNAQIIGYRIERSDGATDPNSFVLHLENLSRSQSPDKITVAADVNAVQSRGQQGCVRALFYYPETLSTATSPEGSDPGRQGFDRISTSTPLTPGASFNVFFRYKSTCTVTPRITIVSSGSSRPQLLPLGLESFVMKYQFAIVLMLTILFALVFAISFAVSVTLTWSAKK